MVSSQHCTQIITRSWYATYMQDASLNTLQQQIGQSTGTTVPNLDLSALMPLMITSIVVTIILTLLFLIYVSFNTIRRYKVEKATLEMQKDIRRMRELMEEQASSAVAPSVDLLATVEQQENKSEVA